VRTVFTIWWRDLKAVFVSPVAYVVMVVFLSITGWVFLQLIEGQTGALESLPVLLFKVMIFFWLPALTAVITMRTFAEEKRSGTIETLMTSPISESQIVLGKFMAAWSFLLVVTLPALSNLWLLVRVSPALEGIDIGAVAGGLVLFAVLGGMCIAVGMLASLCTRNQIVAFVTCFAAVLMSILAGEALAALPYVGGAGFESLLLSRHVVDFARGLVDMRPLVIYVTMTAWLLFLAVRLLEWSRWR
jgi:ABC-2 type transport system permease protein